MSIPTLYEQFENIQAQLVETQKSLQAYDRILALLASIDEQIQYQEHRLKALTPKLHQKQDDLQLLEGRTIEALFFTLVGKKKQKLQEVADDYLALKTEYQTCQTTLAVLQNQSREFEELLVSLAEYNEVAEQLNREQEHLIAQLHSSESKRFIEIGRLLPPQQELQKKLQKAMESGHTAQKTLQKIITALEIGRDLDGKWELHSTTILGDSYLHQAAQLAQQGQILLDGFQADLTAIAYQLYPAPSMKIPVEVSEEKAIYQLFMQIEYVDDIMEGQIYKKIQLWLYHLQQMLRAIQLKLMILEEKLGEVQVLCQKLELEKAVLLRQIWQPASFR